MRCGISTACFFPEETLDALKRVIDTGAPVTELFLNTFSEIEDSYLAKLLDEVKSSHIKVISVHPFSSAMEGFFFASHYKGRFADGMKLYRRLFEVCQVLDADKLVFHGDHRANPAMLPLTQYAQNFCEIAKVSKEYGVTLCHENVVYCRLGSVDTVKEISPLLGEYAAFTLDLKQVHREGALIDNMLGAMGHSIKHVHISDYTMAMDCTPPGTGQFNFDGFIEALCEMQYKGDMVVELYRDGFKTTQQLVDAMQYIQTLLDKQ